MYVICKKCGAKIAVANRPSGFTRTSGTRFEGNVRLEGGRISFGPGGGKLIFDDSGVLGFGPPIASEFSCVDCGHVDSYHAEEIKD